MTNNIKTVEKLSLHPLISATLENDKMFYSEIERSNVMKPSNESPTSFSYQSDCTLTFQAFCRSLSNVAVLTVINYLAEVEICTT